MLDGAKKRAVRLLIFYAALLAVGLIYALICRLLGGGIPCVFHTLTGLYCPGCGITRMFLCLLRGDLMSAWLYNPAVLLLLPAFAAVFVHLSKRYVKDGTLAPRKWASILMYCMIGVLLAFGVLRNI